MIFLAYYIHDLNPVIFHIYGPAAVRWYGLAYLSGFITAFFLLKYLIRKNKLHMPEKILADFIMWAAFLGVMAGGRIGYILLYDFNYFIHHPVMLLEIWHGGMSSHGGMAGVILVMIWFARKHKLSFWNIADNMACVVPVGLFFGRLANFINGELYGKITNIPWAVIFKDANGSLTDPRHPSQLYEAAGEGLLLFTILWLLRFTKYSIPDGRLSGFFLVAYGVIRIFVEIFREPDADLILGLSRGQFYSLFCVLAGLGILLLRRPKRS